jgi:hypothetical protein
MPRPLNTELGGTGRNDGLNLRGGTYVSLTDYGGDPTGAVDSSSALSAALAAGSRVDMTNGTWLFNSSVSVPAGRFIDMGGSNIVLNTGAAPFLQFLNAASGLYILHGGGVISGTASAFLFAQGVTNTPSSQSDYASQIYLNGVVISSTTITQALQFDKAVKQFTAEGCFFFTPSGVNASGKCVEVRFSNCIIYGATGSAGTFGVKLRSTGGTTSYNEGWHFVNCPAIDNFEISFDVTDIFVMTVADSYIGVNAGLSSSTGYSFQFQAPSTNLCESINISGCVIAGRTRFASSAGGRDYNYVCSDFVATGIPGIAFSLENNASSITISNGKFKAGSGTAQGVIGANNNHNINTSNLEFDSTYTNGVVYNGAAGVNCAMGPLFGPTSGDVFGAARNGIRYLGVPIHSTITAAFKQTVSSANLGGGATYTVGTAIATLAFGFPRGETGDILVCLSFSGANAGTQNVQIGVPAGMVIPSGTGFSAGNLYLGAATGLLFARVPYYCTADGTGNVTVTNQAGNTLTVNNQGYCAIIRNQ